MLLEFNVSNLLSFNENTTFTMQSGFSRAEIFNENTIFQGLSNTGKKMYVHNSAIIYGANASGKSNLFYAIAYLRDIVKNSYKNDTDPVMFKFNEGSEPTKLGIRFIQKIDVEYEFDYQIHINKQGEIVEESLYCKGTSKKGKKQVIFSREEGAFLHFHEDINYLIENYKTTNIEKKAALSFLINNINKTFFKDTMNSLGYKLLEAAYKFIVEKIVISGAEKDTDKLAEVLENPEFKRKVINALSEIDNSIEDFEVLDLTDLLTDKMTEMLNSDKREHIPDSIIEQFEFLKKNKKKILDFRTIHTVQDKDYALDYNLESSGTRKFINDFIDIIDCLENNKVYIIDEIENHYHEFIQRYILDLFLNQDEDKTAQIIATTHSIEFLDPNRFAKEQIWFVEKKRSTQATSLYRLSDFKDITYNNHNWKNLYIQGRLGAVPKVIM